MSRPVLIGPEVLVATPAAALAVSVPAALRLSSERFGFFESWFAVAGLLCPVLALAFVAVRAARRAVRTAPPGSGPPLLAGAALWALGSLPVTALLGAVLKANTHHRALGGATFAVFALAVQVAALLVAWRVTAIVFSRIRRPSARTAFATALAAAALVLFVVTVAAGASAQDAPPEASSAARIPALLVDGALAFVATVLAAKFDVPANKAPGASWVGGGFLVFVTAIGLAVAATSPSLGRALSAKAPLGGVAADAMGLSGDP